MIARELFSKVYRAFSSVYLFFVVLSSPPLSSWAAADSFYLDELVQSAQEANLAEDRYWDTLVHYKPSGASRRVSLVDDPKFFLAPDGKKNPAAELEATIRSFFTRQNEDEEHPQCRFIARYDWLKERLAIDDLKLPRVTCAKFDEAYSLMNPASAVLVFPAAYGNGPASMFGHTLVRIDGSSQSDLLSYAVSYAAFATDDNGFLYAFKGAFGYYRGYFSILPYYVKVSEYNDMEHRDMWEYQLNLSPEEVRRMVLHIWELKDVYSDYFFFDENCSFHLLFLLEAARPSVALTDRFWHKPKFWVIPVDTIRIVEESGLIHSVRYRPSQAIRIRTLAVGMSVADQRMTLDVANRKYPPATVLKAPLEPAQKMQILDLSAEVLQYKLSRKSIEKEEYLRWFLPTLQARSELGSSPHTASVLQPPQPQEGHLPAKLSLAAGIRERSSFLEIGWRAAYHELLDPDEGYMEGSQINFMNVRGRYFPTDRAFKLQSLRLIDIVSLSPRDRFFKPVSWKVNTGFDREIMPGGEERLLFRVNPGGGFAFESRVLGLSYAMLETDVNLNQKLDHRFSAGIGLSAGTIKSFADRFKIALDTSAISYQAGEEHTTVKVSLKQSTKLSANTGIRLHLSREKTFGWYRTEGSASWNLYF